MTEKQKIIQRFALSSIFLFIAYLPMLKWMIHRWTEPESYYGHGFLIPIVSLYIAWQRRELLKKARLSGQTKGLVIIALGLFVHVICAALKVYFISGFSFVFVLYGLILFFFGKEVARNLLFPLFFLFAMIPLPLVLIGNLTVKLKLFVAQISTIILNKIGFPSIRDGSLIRMPNSYIMIEAPCSGLRSLISLLTLGLLFSFAMKMSYVKKGLLFISSVPIAIATNIIRVLMLATVNDLYGEKITMGFFHDFSGYMMFGIAFISLYTVSRIFEPNREISNG